MREMRNGIYNYRFSGDSMKLALPYRIVGVGSLELSELSIRNGHHRSSVMVLQGGTPKLIHSYFLLTGTASYQSTERNWDISLHFVEQNPRDNKPAQNLYGKYRAVPVGDDRYWIISAGAEVLQQGQMVPAHEIVSGEVIRVGDA